MLPPAISAPKVPLREVVFLALIAALPPLSTDMYLGAMPTIASQWQVSSTYVSLSLILWFVSFSMALLGFGPLSDKYGRKPVLMAGLGLFALASLMCAMSTNVTMLIAGRLLQGVGAAGPSAMVMAISRDRYQGQQRKQVLAFMGIIVALAPMVAPIIGTTIMHVASWRTIFLTQGMYALGCLMVVLGFAETLPQRVTEQLWHLMGRYRFLFGNSRYMLANAIMGLLAAPLFGFIALSSKVYITIFDLSEQMFSALFGLNALMLMLGAAACTRLTRRFSDTALLTTCMIGAAVGATGILIAGSHHYLAFACTMSVVTFCGGMSRPLSNHLILDQVSTDIGSASSFSVFYVFIVGACSMAFVSAPWKQPILAFAIMAVSVPTIVLMLWPVLLGKLASRDAENAVTSAAAVDSDMQA